MLNGKTKP